MAMQAIGGWHSVFQPHGHLGAAYTSNISSGITASGQYYAFLFKWGGGDLTKIGFLPHTITGTCTVSVRLYNVDTSNSTNPINRASPIGSAVTSGTLTAGTLCIVSGIGQASLPAGCYAVCIDYSAGTTIKICTHATSIGDYNFINNIFPTAIGYTGSTTKIAATCNPPVMFGNAAEWLPMAGFFPAINPSLQPYNSSSSPNEYGIWFANPFPFDIRVCGVRVYQNTSGYGDCVFSYYSGSLASPVTDTSLTLNSTLATSTLQAGMITILFDAKQTLPAGGFAGIGIRAATATNFQIGYLDFGSGNQALMDSFWGQNATKFSRVGGSGALTQVNYQTPFIMPLFDAANTGSGGGYPRSRILGA